VKAVHKSIIVAMSENRAIGLDGDLPWHISPDLKRFKQLTMGHHLIMGRRTFESVRVPLPGRKIIVLTRRPAYEVAGGRAVNALEKALDLAEAAGEDEVFIGGGAEVYARALPLADRIYLTLVHAQIAGDTFFPEIDWNAWLETWREHHPAGEGWRHPFTFIDLARRVEAGDL
jgi:dihydrofolate reductase